MAGEFAPGWNICWRAGVLSNEEQDLARLQGLETQAEFQNQLAAGHVSGVPGVVWVVWVGWGACDWNCHFRMKLWSRRRPDAAGLFNVLVFLPARPLPAATVAGLTADVIVSVCQEFRL